MLSFSDSFGAVVTIWLSYNILCMILPFICKVFIISIGWKLSSFKDLKTAKSLKKSICIFTHTSYADCIIGGIYRIAEGMPWYAGITEEYFPYFGLIFRANNCIPVPNKPTIKNGFVNFIIQYFKNYKDDWAFCLDPEGSLRLSPWRTGWYWMAKGLNVPVTTHSYDFHDHCVKYGPRFNLDDYSAIEDLETDIKNSMNNITALYPECSQVSNKKSSSLIDYKATFCFYLWLIMVFISMTNSISVVPFYLFLSWIGTIYLCITTEIEYTVYHSLGYNAVLLVWYLANW